MSDYTQLKAQLEEKLRELTSRVQNIDAELAARGEGESDWEERATEIEDDEVNSVLGNMSIEEMKQIRHALHQMDSGRYGICEVCGGRIQLGRLEALPFATTCSHCA